MKSVDSPMSQFYKLRTPKIDHYARPTLQEHSYDTTIIHVAINDILRSKSCKNYQGKLSK